MCSSAASSADAPGGAGSGGSGSDEEAGQATAAAAGGANGAAPHKLPAAAAAAADSDGAVPLKEASSHVAVPFTPITLVCRDLRCAHSLMRDWYEKRRCCSCQPLLRPSASPSPLHRYYVNDPTRGESPSVVKSDAAAGGDKEIVGKLELLKGISFYAEPGCLMALMGGSGAGGAWLAGGWRCLLVCLCL